MFSLLLVNVKLNLSITYKYGEHVISPIVLYWDNHILLLKSCIHLNPTKACPVLARGSTILVGIVWSRCLASSEAKGINFMHFRVEILVYVQITKS